jgi:hypothetical protein
MVAVEGSHSRPRKGRQAFSSSSVSVIYFVIFYRQSSLASNAAMIAAEPSVALYS